MPTVEVNGTDLYYEVAGTGPPCLVLHGGLGVDQTIYRSTLAPLADVLQLVFVDHRCNGRSGRPPIETLTMEQLADDAAGLADRLGFETFLVLGHSYGGFVAQELVLRHPERLRAALLVATTAGQPGTGEDPDVYAGPPPPPEFAEALSDFPASDDEYAALTLRLLRYYLHRRDPDEVAPLLDGTIYSRVAMVRGFEVLARWSSIDRLSSVACPVLLLVGTDDLFTAASQSHRIADRLKDAEVVVFDQCGHFPWLEDPDQFFTAIRHWLRRQDLNP